ncbi:MAG: hypothetical protein JO353_09755 [Phycisphaerae bacterium]|nr:hypothetical protein [Phycisphaerae bacterium]
MPGESPMAALRRKNGRQDPWPISLWGVGNENWGCGGNMRPQYYADLFRQFASYCRHFTPGKKLYKVACGLNNEWNEILLRNAVKFMDGLSIHYYTVPGIWTEKGSATDFAAEDWKLTIQKAANIEFFIQQTAAILDRYDPNKRVGIVMDEWGTWFDVEPGTNPGFLYQQNTIRDALVAGLTLNIFNNHADRVQVANIAQTVNVLQAMVLTDGEKMLLTPTYHVFEMFKAHQGATMLPTTVHCDIYAEERPTPGASGIAGQIPPPPLTKTPQISASASRDQAGKIHLSLCNVHHEQSDEASIHFRGITPTNITARILTGPMHAMNTFDNTEEVKPAPFDEFKLNTPDLTISLPPRSVVMLDLH